MPMKAIPMKGRLRGKKIAGYLWAEPWQRKENYFQLEHNKLVSAVLACRSGSFWVRCTGSSCEISLHKKGRVLATTVLTLPHGRKRAHRIAPNLGV